MKRFLVAVLGLALALLLVTWWALEWSGVAVVTTRSPDGSPRETHVWFVHDGDELWLEAGTPDNPWFLDVRNQPELALVSDRLEGRFVARPSSDPRQHRRVRELLRAKYGVRDAWVGLFVDSSQSLAVRLLPIVAFPK